MKMNSIRVDWGKEGIFDEWEFTGANLIRQREQEKLDECTHGNKNDSGCSECDCYPDDREQESMPMMNYACPIGRYGAPTDDKILEVCNRTNCTVVYNIDEENL